MDDLDRQILDHLARDGRLTMAELGRRIGLSRTATLARVRALEAGGAILGYAAQVRRDARAASHEARVGIVLRSADPSVYVRRLARFPELQEAESVAGEYDLIVRFAAGSAGRLDEILDRISGWSETVRTTTWMVLRTHGLDRPAR